MLNVLTYQRSMAAVQVSIWKIIRQIPHTVVVSSFTCQGKVQEFCSGPQRWNQYLTFTFHINRYRGEERRRKKLVERQRRKVNTFLRKPYPRLLKLIKLKLKVTPREFHSDRELTPEIGVQEQIKDHNW